MLKHAKIGKKVHASTKTNLCTHTAHRATAHGTAAKQSGGRTKQRQRRGNPGQQKSRSQSPLSAHVAAYGTPAASDEEGAKDDKAKGHARPRGRGVHGMCANVMMGAIAAITCMMPQPTEAVTHHMMARLHVNSSTQSGATFGRDRSNLISMSCTFSKSIEYMFEAPGYQDKNKSEQN